MAVDLRRIALAAVDAAFDQQQESTIKKRKRRHLPATRALLIGAGLMTAGRVALSGRGRRLLDSVEERLAQFELRDGDADLPPEEDEEFEDEEFGEPEDEEEPGAYDEEEEEPEAYEDEEDPEDYEGDEEEPEAYEDEGYEDESDYDDDEPEDEEPEEEIDERRKRTTVGSRRRRRS
jgi:hypothetical protein